MTGIQTYRFQKYQKTIYRNREIQGKEIQITYIYRRKKQLQNHTNTNYRNTNIEVKRYKLQDYRNTS